MHPNCIQQQKPADMISWVYNLPSLGSYNLSHHFSPSLNRQISSCQTTDVQRESHGQNYWKRQYQSQHIKNIILNQKKESIQETLKVSKISKSEQQNSRAPRKSAQKETRNIGSNLLRIFFKNLIELRIYSDQIDLLLRRVQAHSSKEAFYMWIESFGINFKNYIRGCQIGKILDKDQPAHFRRIFLALLKLYSMEGGIQHCLTSKRIERASVKMHLLGLRQLLKTVQKCP